MILDCFEVNKLIAVDSESELEKEAIQHASTGSFFAGSMTFIIY